MCSSSGCYNKIPHKLFVTVLEAGSLRLGCQHARLGLSSRLQICGCIFIRRNGLGDLCGVSFVRTLIPLIRATPLSPYHLPKAPSTNAITFGRVRMQHNNFKETNIQTLAVTLSNITHC